MINNLTSHLVLSKFICKFAVQHYGLHSMELKFYFLNFQIMLELGSRSKIPFFSRQKKKIYSLELKLDSNSST